MKRCFILSFLLMIFLNLQSQIDNNQNRKDNKQVPSTNKASQPTAPIFPGGDKALLKFLKNNLEYPASAKRDNIQGQVLVGFWVLKSGEISNVSILRSVRSDLDSSAIATINKLPKWTPGTVNNVPIPVFYKLPIDFKLKTR